MLGPYLRGLVAIAAAEQEVLQAAEQVVRVQHGVFRDLPQAVRPQRADVAVGPEQHAHVAKGGLDNVAVGADRVAARRPEDERPDDQGHDDGYQQTRQQYHPASQINHPRSLGKRLCAEDNRHYRQRHTGAAGTQPEQLNGLRSMVGEQQHTIAKLQSLINTLAPEAGKARELADAFASVQHANQELSGCVAVLEDENALLRSELEEMQAKVAHQEADAREGEAGGGQQAGEAGLSEQKEELQVKVQELEALLEFKDAAIQELETQYNLLESKDLAASGQKKA